MFGKQWHTAVPLAQLLALQGLAYTLPWAAGDAFKAMGRPGIITKFMTVEYSIAIPAAAIVAYTIKDAFAVILTLLIISSVAVVVRLSVATRVLEFFAVEYIGIFRTAFLSSLVMCSAVIASRWLTHDVGTAAKLSVMIAVGVLVYIGTVLLIDRKAVEATRDVIASLYRSKAR